MNCHCILLDLSVNLSLKKFLLIFAYAWGNFFHCLLDLVGWSSGVSIFPTLKSLHLALNFGSMFANGNHDEGDKNNNNSSYMDFIDDMHSYTSIIDCFIWTCRILTFFDKDAHLICHTIQ